VEVVLALLDVIPSYSEGVPAIAGAGGSAFPVAELKKQGLGWDEWSHTEGDHGGGWTAGVTGVELWEWAILHPDDRRVSK